MKNILAITWIILVIYILKNAFPEIKWNEISIANQQRTTM